MVDPSGCKVPKGQPSIHKRKREIMPSPINQDRIGFLRHVAVFIFQEASKLVRDGLGTDLHGSDVEGSPIIDEIPMDSSQYRFFQQVLRFVMYIGQALDSALIEDLQNMDPESDFIIDDGGVIFGGEDGEI